MEITDNIIILAERLAVYLKIEREKNRVTPEEPITAIRIVDIAYKAGIKTSREEVYQAVHYLRWKKVPIASSQRGYFYATKSEEFEPMIAEQIKRIKESQETLSLAKELKENLFKEANSIFNDKAESKESINENKSTEATND